jgi:hypothetical protein
MPRTGNGRPLHSPPLAGASPRTIVIAVTMHQNLLACARARGVVLAGCIG